MSEIVLFHSVLGLRAGVLDAADRLRAAGHTVHTPDYFDGRTYDEYPPAFEFLDEIGGIPDVDRPLHGGRRRLPPGSGVCRVLARRRACQLLAATRSGAQGLIMLHTAIPLDALGVPGLARDRTRPGALRHWRPVPRQGGT